MSEPEVNLTRSHLRAGRHDPLQPAPGPSLSGQPEVVERVGGVAAAAAAAALVLVAGRPTVVASASVASGRGRGAQGAGIDTGTAVGSVL